METATLDGLPSMDELLQMRSQFDQPQASPDGLPSMGELLQMRQNLPPSPLEQEQQLHQDYIRAQAGQMAQDRQGSLFGNMTNPIAHGLLDAGFQSVAQPAAMALNIAGKYSPLAITAQAAGIPNPLRGLDVSGAVLNEQEAHNELARQERGGKPEGTLAHYTRVFTTGIADVLATANVLGKVGLGKKAYLATIGARTYDSSLKEADEAGLDDVQRQTYAAANATAEVAFEALMAKLGKGVMGKLFPKTPQNPVGSGIVKQTIGKRLFDLGKTGGEEALEEGGTQLSQNLNGILHGVKPFSMDSLFEGVGESMVVGGMVGGAVGGIHHAGEMYDQQAQPQQPPVAPQQPPQPQPAPQQAPAVAPELEAATNAQQPAPGVPANVATMPQSPMVPPDAAALPQAPTEQPSPVAQAEPPAAEVPVEQPKQSSNVEIQRIDRDLRDDLEYNNAQLKKMGVPEKLEALNDGRQLLKQKYTPEDIRSMTPEERKQAIAGHADTPIAPSPTMVQEEANPVVPQKPETVATPQPRPVIGPKNAAPYMEADVSKAEQIGIADGIRKAAEIRVPYPLSHENIASNIHKYGLAKDVPHSELSRIVAAVRGDVGEWVRREANSPVAAPITPQNSHPISQPLPSNPLVRQEQEQQAAVPAVETKPPQKPQPAAESEPAVAPQEPAKTPPSPEEKAPEPRKKITADKPFALETKPRPETKTQDFGNNKTEGKPLFVGANDLPGQKYLVPDVGRTVGDDLPEPETIKRKAAAAKGVETKTSNAEDLNLHRVADSEGVPPDDLRDAVDRETTKDREHWQALKEVVGNPLTPGERKKLQNGDEDSLPKKRLDELRDSLESETGSRRNSGLSYDEVYDAMANGMPPEPSAKNEAYVRRVASQLKQELEDRGNTSFNPQEDENGHISFHKGPVPTLESRTKPPASEPISENAVRDALSKIFDIPIFRGRVKQLANGQFQEGDKVIRLKSKLWASIVLATHEIGHAIDKETSFVRNASPAVQAELMVLDYGPKKNNSKEGFAEFVRQYLTTDDAASNTETFTSFYNMMESNRELGEKMDKARELVDRLRVRDPMDVVLSQQNENPVALEEKNGAWDKLKDKWDDWTLKYLEAMHNRQERVLKTAAASDKITGRDPEIFYNLWNRLSGSDYRRAVAALSHGVHTVSGNPKKLYAKAPKEIMEPIKGEELEKFSGYYYAQVFLAHMARKPGYDPGLTVKQLNSAIDEVKKDADQFDRFDKAAREMTQYFHALQDLQAHEGAKSWEEAKRIKDSMPDYFAPIFRQAEFGVDKSGKKSYMGGSSGFLNVKATARRLGQGSGDQYMNLYDALVKENADAHRVAVKYAMAVPFLRRLLPSLGGAYGMGDQITQVDPKNVRDSVRLGKIIDQLSKPGPNGEAPIVDPDENQLIKDVEELRYGTIGPAALKRLEALYGPGDLRQLRADTADVRSAREVITFYKQDFGLSEKEHIMFFHLNGQEIGVQFKSPDLWRAMSGIRNLGEANVYSTVYSAIADGFQNKITKPLQAMSVGMNPTAVAAMSLLDYPAFTWQSKHTGFIERFVAPLYNVVRLAAAMSRRDFGGKVPKWASDLINDISPELVKREVRAGAILMQAQAEESGTVASNKLFGESKLTHEQVKHQFLPQMKQATRYATVSQYLAGKAETYRDWMAALDSGMRLAEMTAYARSKGYTINKNASMAKIDAGKNSWIDPSGAIVDAPPSHILAGMMRHNNEVLTNYKPKGYLAAEMGKFMPFFTARMAGLRKEVGTTLEMSGGIGRVSRSQPPAVEGFGPRIAAMATWATAAALYAWFHHDDDDRKGMDPSIANRFWTFSEGGVPFAKIAKPRGYGIFINTIEGLVEMALDGRNPHLLEKLGVEAQELTPIRDMDPGNWPAGFSTMYQLARNKDWAGKPIENEYDVKSGLQTAYRVQPNTLDSSKYLSRYFTQYLGLSPAKTEYLLNQMTGSMYGDLVGTTENTYKSVTGQKPFDWRSLPIVRREAAHGLYQRSIGEFYDQYKVLESNVNTAKDQGWDDDQTKIEAEKFRQMDRYKDVLTTIRKASNETKDAELKLKLQTYSVGLADYAMGKEERDSYPNPLRNTGKALPPEMVDTKTKRDPRTDFILSLAHSITANPNPHGIRTKEQAEKFPQRMDESKVRREWAAAELKRLGYAPQEVAKIVIQANAKRGVRTTPETVGEMVAAMK